MAGHHAKNGMWLKSSAGKRVLVTQTMAGGLPQGASEAEIADKVSQLKQQMKSQGKPAQPTTDTPTNQIIGTKGLRGIQNKVQQEKKTEAQLENINIRRISEVESNNTILGKNNSVQFNRPSELSLEKNARKIDKGQSKGNNNVVSTKRLRNPVTKEQLIESVSNSKTVPSTKLRTNVNNGGVRAQAARRELNQLSLTKLREKAQREGFKEANKFNKTQAIEAILLAKEKIPKKVAKKLSDDVLYQVVTDKKMPEGKKINRKTYERLYINKFTQY